MSSITYKIDSILYIAANGGNDVLIGGDGIDTLTGHAGKDLIIGDLGNVTFHPSSPQRIIYASTVYSTDSISANDKITGNEDDDIIFGGNGSDNMYHSLII